MIVVEKNWTLRLATFVFAFLLLIGCGEKPQEENTSQDTDGRGILGGTSTSPIKTTQGTYTKEGEFLSQLFLASEFKEYSSLGHATQEEVVNYLNSNTDLFVPSSSHLNGIEAGESDIEYLSDNQAYNECLDEVHDQNVFISKLSQGVYLDNVWTNNPCGSDSGSDENSVTYKDLGEVRYYGCSETEFDSWLESESTFNTSSESFYCEESAVYIQRTTNFSGLSGGQNFSVSEHFSFTNSMDGPCSQKIGQDGAIQYLENCLLVVYENATSNLVETVINDFKKFTYSSGLIMPARSETENFWFENGTITLEYKYWNIVITYTDRNTAPSYTATNDNENFTGTIIIE
jgi:hypothetical protein